VIDTPAPFDARILLLILPLIAVQLVLMVAALRDLVRPDRRVRGGNKALWAIAICFGELLGPIAYFTWGRVDW
jgi:hypothetical protein